MCRNKLTVTNLAFFLQKIRRKCTLYGVFFNVNMIAGDIISTAAYSMAELEVKSPAAINLIEISNSPANPGNPLTYVFHIFQISYKK